MTTTDTAPTDADTTTTTTTCDHCGEAIGQNDPRHDVNGETWCATCHEEDACPCDNCGTVVANRNTQSVGGATWCDNCVNDAATTCERCEELAPVDDMSSVWIVRPGRRVEAQWCACCRDDNAVTCDRCDSTFDGRDAHDVDGSTWCGSCYEDHAVTCDDCGYTFDSDDMRSTEDGTYCQSCFADSHSSRIGAYHSTRGRGFKPIRSPYPYSRRPGWYGPYRSEMLFGVELEMESIESTTPNEIAESVEKAIGVLFAGAERDGSLRDGVEIVSQPATIDAHRAIWRGLKTRLARGARAHDTTTCGFHIHVTREAISDLTIAKFVDLLSRDESIWSNVFRRTPNHYAKAQKKDKFAAGARLDSDRYQIVNTSSSKTIEVRWPRGTIQPATVLATVEIIHAAIRYCESASIRTLNWYGFKRAILTDPWLRAETKTARAYLHNRGLIDREEDPTSRRPSGAEFDT